MGEHGLEFMFGETVKNIVIGKSLKSIMESVFKHIENDIDSYYVYMFLSFDTFSYMV